MEIENIHVVTLMIIMLIIGIYDIFIKKNKDE